MFPYLELFLALSACYAVASAYTGLDPRYAVLLGLILLVLAAAASGLLDSVAASIFMGYALLLMALGVCLLIVQYQRRRAIARRG